MNTAVNTGLDKAIDAVGGLSKLAARMKVSSQVIANWRRRGIPAERVLEVERATAGADGAPKVMRHELRPDLYPPADPVQLELST